MTATVEPEVMDYSQYKRKKATVHFTDGTSVEGTIEAGSQIGLVLKPKGSRERRLVEGREIKALELASAPIPRLRRKTLPIIVPAKVREHLIDRHGYRIDEISALSEAEAVVFHDSIDHLGADLGHTHREPTEAEQAIAAAEQDVELIEGTEGVTFDDDEDDADE